MDDNKKKKRNNKKKKNKQQAKTTVEDSTSNAGDTSSGEQNLVSDHHKHSNPLVESNGGMGDHASNKVTEEDKGGPNADPANDLISNHTGKQQNGQQEEARLREMVKQLLYEKNSYIQRQDDLETKIKQLQCENDSWHEKVVNLQQRITQLLQEKASLSLGERDLQEKVRHIEKERAVLVEKEKSSNEMIATLNTEKSTLQLQVVELEGSKNNLSQENRLLMDNILTLQSQVHDLEGSLASAHTPVDAPKVASQEDDSNAEIEAACALIEKLVTENAELVEKVNELYMELGSHDVGGDVASVGIPAAMLHDPVSGSNEDVSSSAKSLERFGRLPVGDERAVNDDVDSDYANVARHSSETAVSGEIVQIPLNENDGMDLEAQAAPTNEGDHGVPITDAPLIGAPFRLISFVAKYVSGADLVDQGASESRQLN